MKFFKKIFLTAIVLLMSVGLTGCTSSSNEETLNEGDNEKIKISDNLRVSEAFELSEETLWLISDEPEYNCNIDTFLFIKNGKVEEYYIKNRLSGRPVSSSIDYEAISELSVEETKEFLRENDWIPYETEEPIIYDIYRDESGNTVKKEKITFHGEEIQPYIEIKSFIEPIQILDSEYIGIKTASKSNPYIVTKKSGFSLSLDDLDYAKDREDIFRII